MNMEEAMVNYTHTGKPMNLERKPYKCHFVHHKSHVDCSGIELAASLYSLFFGNKNTTTTNNNNNNNNNNNVLPLQLFNFGHYIQHPII
jgi:hypothetical protein